jgi:tetratricopeptide (TPR) repeat protein
MLKKILYILIFLTSQFVFSQEQKLAHDYFRKGEFEKAASLYESLYKENKHNTYYFKYLIKSYQALEEYYKVENLINERITLYPKQAFLWVELGYNYELQHQNDQAKPSYEKAIAVLKEKPTSGYQIAKSFYDNHLLDYALESYQLMIEVSPTANYNYQIAAIYGEKGDIEKMFDTYLEMISKQGGTLENVQRFIGKYITDDSQDENNILFRKLLIKRLQQNPKYEWNKLLSWIYLQQKDFSKALIQEKAVHKRNQTDLNGVIDVGTIAFEASDYSTTKNAFNYVLATTDDVELQLYAHLYILESDKKLKKELNTIKQAYQKVFEQYGRGSNTVKIQVSYANFLTFSTNQPDKAIEVLEAVLKNRLNQFQKAEIKIQLADILVYTGKYNQALIKYSQVQTNLKNHVLAQKARYKVAQTSYFKGDFDWANIQLKVLKRGTTKLISNDAMDLSLLISDNTAQDSIRTALKSYATADLLTYQNKNQQAIDTLAQVLINHKGHPIEDEALLKQAELFEKTQQFEAAEQNYLNIIALKNNDILIDDALYHLALLYDTQLNNLDKAKIYYERIIFEQPSSIYLVPARKRFRQLRGDTLVP